MISEISILIIYTGGTIGMVKDPQSGALKPFNLENLYQNIPVLKSYPFKIDVVAFEPLIDSSTIKTDQIIELGQVIEKHYESYDGFVILHGSDTMAYTASFLSFMLENLNKPVILTGSQLPLGVLRSDGRENIINAIEMASSQSDGTPLIPEVAVLFENKLYRGNRTHKANAEDFEAFQSVNYPVLANLGVNIKFRYDAIRKPNFKRLKLHPRLNTDVVILKLFPGISEKVVKSIFDIAGLRGVVMETFGSGNAPDYPWFLKTIRKASENGIIVLNVSQSEGGAVEMDKYETGLTLIKAGVISGSDMTTEAAVAKMMYLLGKSLNVDEIKLLLQKPLRGEMTLPGKDVLMKNR